MGASGRAAAASVLDHAMAQRDPLAFRQLSHQVAFDFFGVFFPGQAEPSTEPADVRVDHDARGDAERCAQHHIGGFSADAGQFDQLVELLRHLAVVAFEQRLAAVLDVFGLIAKETGALNVTFQLIAIGPGVIWASETTSPNSASVSQPFRTTSS